MCTLLYGVLLRFSPSERFFSIAVVFSRTFHHLNASLPHQLRSPHFSWFANFPAFSIIYTFPVLCLQVSLPSPFLPPSPPIWSQVHLAVFFSSFAHTSHSLGFSCALCHSRLLHPSLYHKCHKTAEIKLRFLAFLAWERVDTSRRHHCFSRDGETSESNFHPIRSTTQIWVVWRHQYGISTLVPQTSLRWETSCGVRKGRLFSKA